MNLATVLLVICSLLGVSLGTRHGVAHRSGTRKVSAKLTKGLIIVNLGKGSPHYPITVAASSESKGIFSNALFVAHERTYTIRYPLVQKEMTLQFFIGANVHNAVLHPDFLVTALSDGEVTVRQCLFVEMGVCTKLNNPVGLGATNASTGRGSTMSLTVKDATVAIISGSREVHVYQFPRISPENATAVYNFSVAPVRYSLPSGIPSIDLSAIIIKHDPAGYLRVFTLGVLKDRRKLNVFFSPPNVTILGNVLSSWELNDQSTELTFYAHALGNETLFFAVRGKSDVHMALYYWIQKAPPLTTTIKVSTSLDFYSTVAPCSKFGGLLDYFDPPANPTAAPSNDVCLYYLNAAGFAFEEWSLSVVPPPYTYDSSGTVAFRRQQLLPFQFYIEGTYPIPLAYISRIAIGAGWLYLTDSFNQSSQETYLFDNPSGYMTCGSSIVEPCYHPDPTSHASVAKCAPGTFKFFNDTSPCLPCPSGSFANESASMTCSDCAVGSYCPTGTRLPLSMNEVDFSDHSTYEFAARILPAASFQQLLLKTLFAPDFSKSADDPTASSNTQYAIVTRVVAGVFVGGWALFLILSNVARTERAMRRVQRFLVHIDLFGQVQAKSDGHAANEKDCFGSLVTIYCLLILALSTILIFGFLEYHPQLVGDSIEDGSGPSLNSKRTAQILAVGDGIGGSRMEHIVGSFQDSLVYTLNVTFLNFRGDCSANGDLFQPFVYQCNGDQHGSCDYFNFRPYQSVNPPETTRCSVAFDLSQRGAVSPIMGLTVNMDRAYFNALQIRVSTTACVPNIDPPPEEVSNCNAAPTFLQHPLYIYNTFDQIIAGNWSGAVRATQVLRITELEGQGEGDVQRTMFASLTPLQLSSMAPTVNTDTFSTESSVLNLHVNIVPRDFVIVETEERAMRVTDALVVLAVSFLSFVGIARFLAGLEKKAKQKLLEWNQRRKQRAAVKSSLVNGNRVDEDQQLLEPVE